MSIYRQRHEHEEVDGVDGAVWWMRFAMVISFMFGAIR